ncbi:MAG: hypothetical protein A2W23_01555 [Planctomycetes bacterium RBG_16_43_13]|nr:MAG: hypothetical protein A2W23_01555 [Planctomycetes bacterium RBG_16_43_13]
MREKNNSKIHVRVLTLYTDKPFKGYGSDVRRAITARFKDIPVLHNHKGIGFDYKSPRVRYLVLHDYPRLVSFDEGLEIVEQIYHEPSDIRVGSWLYAVTGTELEDMIEPIGMMGEDSYRYRSISPWLALNEENHSIYAKTMSFLERKELLARILIANMLALSKNVNLEIEKMIKVKVNTFTETSLQVGQVTMLGFKIEFETNFRLPTFIGVGKLVSKGFGVMQLIHDHRI